MPSLAAIATIEFPYKVNQQAVKECAKRLFQSSYPQVERMLSAFDNTGIITRNFCRPLSYYESVHTFKEQNSDYIKITLEYAVHAIEQCIDTAAISKYLITDIIFVSTTGLATPSMDALIINEMRLNNSIIRTPVFGLGCAGGVAAYAKANVLAAGNPDAVVLLVAAELCSLTFLKNDFSKSNFIGTSLFADGICACLIAGDNHRTIKGPKLSFVAAQSKFYYDSLDVMGWSFQEDGFKVLFSQDIPKLISANIYGDISNFLGKHGLKITDITNFIFHPGGKKVLDAYENALSVEGDFLHNTRAVMNEHGNMSGPTVLYVLEKFYKENFKEGFGLMVAMGPGFSCEMVLLNMSRK